MARHLCAFAVISALLATISGTRQVLAQKAGGVLKIYHRDSPASMSILEEATKGQLQETHESQDRAFSVRLSRTRKSDKTNVEGLARPAEAR